MKIAVKDANVFIDLEAMGLLDLWLQLGHHTLTSGFVVGELEDGRHTNALACITAGLVEVAVIAAGEWQAFEELRQECEPMGMSVGDVSVLFLASRENAMLLTGDKILRRHAVVQSIEVHGTLWIMDQLVESGRLDATLAAARLEALMERVGAERRYLPRAECAVRIRRWRG